MSRILDGLRVAFKVDRVLYPSKGKRVALYATMVAGVIVMALALAGLVQLKIGLVSGMFLFTLSLTFWVGRATNYIYGRLPERLHSGQLPSQLRKEDDNS